MHGDEADHRRASVGEEGCADLEAHAAPGHPQGAPCHRGACGGGGDEEFAEFGVARLAAAGQGEQPARRRRGGEQARAVVDPPTLRDKLRAMTTVCLTPEQRRRYLAESLADATASWENCERAHGRTPNKLLRGRGRDNGDDGEPADEPADGRATTDAAGDDAIRR